MTDPWYAAAQRIRDEKEAADTAAANQLLAQQAVREEAERAYAQKQAELQRLIDEVTPQLIGFLTTRGEAARSLLGARSMAAGREILVIFGSYRDGSDYDTVALDRFGIARFTGTESSYGHGSHNPRQEATPQQAIEYFARHGQGQNKPEQVRNIVTWLEQEINRLASA